MLQVVGVDVVTKRVFWVKARPDYEPRFTILDGLDQDADKRFWVGQLEVSEEKYDIKDDTGQVSTSVKIALQMSHNTSTRAEEYIQ